MLLQVRLHPLLVTATKDKELMRERLVDFYSLLIVVTRFLIVHTGWLTW